MLSPVTRKHIEEKFGKEIRYPLDCIALSVTIEKNTGDRVSPNTIKRLLGIIDEEREPRLFTLDAIAKYLGFHNWDIYWLSITKSGNSEFGILDEIIVASLPINSEIEFHYAPGRQVIARYVGNFKFVVVSSVLSKLMVDDEVEIRHLFLNYPLIIIDVVRNGNHLGQFTAGKVSGLTYMKLLEQ